MDLWRCSKCGKTVEARATEVVHRCPANQNKPTPFVKEEN